MGLYLAVPLGLILGLVQAALVGEAALLGVRPNLVLLFTLSWVLLRGPREGAIMGVIGGVIMDINSGAVFGVTVLALLPAVSLAGVGEINVFQGAWFLKYMVVLGATLLYNLAMILLLTTGGRLVPFWPALTRIVLPEMLLNLLLMPFAFGIVKFLSRHLGPQAMEL